MDTKKLRQKILDLAIHGKLVPQDLNDEPASVLLERIKAEKEQLIKEGKIKRQKKSASSDTSHYGNIPTGWANTTIGEVFNLQAGKNISSKEIHPTQSHSFQYPCYGGNGIRGYVSTPNRDGNHPIIGRQGALCGNVNLANGAFYATEHAVVVQLYCNMDLKWVFYVLTALNLNQYATATAQPGLAVNVIDDVPLLLPPIQEQERISRKIDTYFSLLESLETNIICLNSDVHKVKSLILDLALLGKLTSDTSHYGKNEETFSETTLGNVCKLCDGEKITGKDYTNLDVKYLRGTKSGDMLHSGRFVPAGSLMILVDGENSGEVFTTPIDGYQGSTFKILDIDAKYCKEFILLLIQSNRKSLRENKVGSAIPHLNKKMFKEIVVPPFSYSEQCEIAQTVKDYFCVLDSIVG